MKTKIILLSLVSVIFLSAGCNPNKLETNNENSLTTQAEVKKQLGEEDVFNIPTGWVTFSNKRFGYSISHPVDITVQGALGDFYGVDVESISTSQPVVEVGSNLGITASIEIHRNSSNYSVTQWADKIIINDQNNLVKNQRISKINGRDALSFEYSGIKLDNPDKPNDGGVSTLENIFTIILIKDKDSIISINYPSSNYENCGKCSVYPKLFETFRFIDKSIN